MIIFIVGDEMNLKKKEIGKIVIGIILLALVFFLVSQNKYNDDGLTYDSSFDGTTVQYNPSMENRIRQYFTADTIIVIFYIVLIIIFRKHMNANNPTLKTLARISLMILSAYFSYKAFLNLNVPTFLSVIGGMGFVIGVVEAKTQYMTARHRLHKGKRDGMRFFFLFATVMAIVLDISMTAAEFVTSEGKQANKQKVIHERAQIEKSRADAKMIEFLNSLTASGNFDNARIHSQTYFGQRDQKSTEPEKEFAGPLTNGLTNLFGNERGKSFAAIFIMIISCSITVMMITFDDQDRKTHPVLPYYDLETKPVVAGAKSKNTGIKNGIGFRVDGKNDFQIENEIENENFKNENETENENFQNENGRRKKNENLGRNFQKVGNSYRMLQADQKKMKVKKLANKTNENRPAKLAGMLKNKYGIELTPQRIGQILRDG